MLLLYNPIYTAWLDLQSQLSVFQSHESDQSLFIGPFQAQTTMAHVRLKWWTNKKSFSLLDFCCPPMWSKWAETRTTSRLLHTALLQAGALRDVDKVRSLYVNVCLMFAKIKKKTKMRKSSFFLLDGFCSKFSINFIHKQTTPLYVNGDLHAKWNIKITVEISNR